MKQHAVMGGPAARNPPCGTGRRCRVDRLVNLNLHGLQARDRDYL